MHTSGTLNTGILVQALLRIAAKRKSYGQFWISIASDELIHGGLKNAAKACNITGSLQKRRK
jgi:hypothetical protein